jgi:tetratricopeptide (TPR) repeat protein
MNRGTAGFNHPGGAGAGSRPNTSFHPTNNSGINRGGLAGGGTRPGEGGSGTRFNPGNRPGGDNIANRGNRDNLGNRANIGNTANIGNRANIGNTANLGNNVNVNRNNFNNFNGSNLNHGNWYHGGWNGNWNHPWYNHPAGWGWGWGAAGLGLGVGLAAAAIPWSSGYYSYSNPYYYATPGVVGNSAYAYDYSQPIMSATPATTQVASSAAPPADQPSLADQSGELFDSSRASFMSGDYNAALGQVDQAIALMPNDPVLHEFRGLVLFALGKYKDAAAVDYAVLSAGPGWDWTTVSGLYPSVEVYTQQLRALEAYCKQNPTASDARFVLAYQYLTTGANDAAATELKQVVKLNPKDQLSAQLLAGLTTVPDEKQSDSPATTPAPATPATPVTASSLAGKWQSTRPDGSTITLDLAVCAKGQEAAGARRELFGGGQPVDPQ